MGQLFPIAPDKYDRTNEQQTRRILEDKIFDIQAQLYAMRTSVGTTRFTDGDIILVNGNNNDVAPGYSDYVRMSGPTGAFTITGLSGGELGRLLVINNSTSQSMTIANQSASSVAANRIATKSGTDVVLSSGGGSAAVLQYDASISRWVLIATRPSDSGTGGSLLKANNLSDVANAGTSRTNLGVAYAVETDQEAATSTSLVASPGNMIYHPGVAKAWLALRVVPTVVSGNISSVAQNPTNQITWSTTHGLSTGDVIYSTGGTWPTGVTAAAAYYVRAVSGTVFQLHTSAAGAQANTGIVSLTSAGSGTMTMNKLVQTVKVNYNFSGTNLWISGRTDIANQLSMSVTMSGNAFMGPFGALTDNTNFASYLLVFRNFAATATMEVDAYNLGGTQLLYSALTAASNYDFAVVVYGDI